MALRFGAKGQRSNEPEQPHIPDTLERRIREVFADRRSIHERMGRRVLSTAAIQ